MYSIIIIGAIIALDQFIKFKVIEEIMPYSSLEVIKNLFYITYVENRGISFGLFKGNRSGAIGNLIDRIRLGYVVDYIHFTFFPPVFNLADSAIVCGAIILSCLLIFNKNITL